MACRLSPRPAPGAEALPLYPPPGRSGSARVSRRLRSRFHGGRRTADPRPDERGGSSRRVRRYARDASQQALPALFCGGEGSAQQYRHRRQRRLNGGCRGEGRRPDISEPRRAEGAAGGCGRNDRARRDPLRRAAAARHGGGQSHAGPGRIACAPLQRGVDRAARPARALAGIRHHPFLHRELAADHRQGHDGAHGTRSPPPSDFHGRPRRPPGHRSRGSGDGRRISLYHRRPRRDGARGHRRATIRGCAGRGDHRVAGRVLPALDEDARNGAAHPPAARIGRGSALPRSRACRTDARAGRRSKNSARDALARPYQQIDARPYRGPQPKWRGSRVAQGARSTAVSPARRRLARASARKSMKTSIAAKLDQARQRLQDVGALLSSESATRDLEQFRKLSREHAELEPVVELFNKYRDTEQHVAEAQELLDDPEMRSYAESEIKVGRERLAALESELQTLLLPKDPNDERNIFLEIRAGTGGDESALFAGDLFRMYSRYSERQGWQVEVISESPGDAGGYKEIIARIIGHGAYSKLKFESGGHRVQRVPATETQGRIHTSACTVAVLPEASAIGDVVLNPSDLRIDTYRASGAGGQHVNKTDSAVRVTHLPTGIVVECQDARSQHKNKEKALAVLAARIKDKQRREQQAKEAATRKSLIGSGDRSERIRTYNFPQGRVTDHRIGLTLYKINDIMDGDLSQLTQALLAEHQTEQLAAFAEER